jgi:ribosomal protein L31
MSHAPSLASVFAEAAKYFPSPLQQFQFFDKTSRFDYEKGRRETWPETVDRAVEYLCELAPPMTGWLRSEGREMILTMQALPSMRLLAMAGPAARRQNLSIYNCAYLPVDDVEAFPEMLIISMSGCGVGFSVERLNIDKLPPVAVQAQEHPCVHIVEDSTEGWAGALRVGIRAWWLDGYEVTFDTSHVRPAGAVLFTKGGRASGPEPLLRMLDTFKRVLLARQGQYLRSIDVHDLACAVGDAAVSGGMRRTAMISLYSQGDALMRAAKTGEYPAIRWNANNSEVWRRDPTDEEIETQMRTMFAGQNGEPGIFSGAAAARTMPVRRREMWQSDLGVSVEEVAGTNPCQPAFATVLTPDGIRTFADIDVGSTIWSGKRWTRVVRKVYTGVKPVQMYVTNCGHFIGTAEHKVISRGRRIEAQAAHMLGIDTSPFPPNFKLDAVKFNFNTMSTSRHEAVASIAPLGDHPVYDITVDADEHTYWTGGLLVSNCGEIVLRPFGLCNLSIPVARVDDTITTLRRKVRAATIFGTIQATATKFPGLRPQWQQNAERERLLGVDITGQMDCPLLTGRRADRVFAELRELSREVNDEMARVLGIAPAAAITTVKPAGNSAALLNCGSGVHGRHSRFYVRNARVSAHSPVYKVLRDAGAPLSPENGQDAGTASTWVCAFPCRAPEGAVLKADLPARAQLAHWLLNKRHWTDHNPSCTITYRPEEEAELIAWVKAHREEIGGISFLPAFDAAYEQMPYVEVDEAEYERRLAAFPAIDWSRIALYEQTDTTTSAQELVCTGDRCELK